MPHNIDDFVGAALEKGAKKSEIEVVLAAHRWPKEEIKTALAQYGDELQFGLAVPCRKPYVSAKEAFLYLLMFLMLYISASNFGSLLFELINVLLPGSIQTRCVGLCAAIRFEVASLIVAFPLYLVLAITTGRAVRSDPEKRNSKVRKWLTYLTLFVAASIIVGDLIALVFNLLGGEMTLRFFLKVVTIGAIAALIFGYYLWDLRQDDMQGTHDT